MRRGVTFKIQGQELMGLNGGPEFKFSEASPSCGWTSKLVNRR